MDVTPARFGFDLKFHSGYDVSLPLRELAGRGPSLVTVIFRVTPEGGQSTYLSQQFHAPALGAEARGEARLHGDFVLGEGAYRIDWLLRDTRQRICASHWQLHADLPASGRLLPLGIAPGGVQASRSKLFEGQSRVARGPLRVKIMVNFAPQEKGLLVLPSKEQRAIVTMLRDIGREPRIGSFTVVAFNLRDEQLLYRQPAAPKIDFPALGKALDSRPGGTIDVRRLAKKHGETDFLRRLLFQELNSPEKTDAVIFLGPKALLDRNLFKDSLKLMGSLGYPVFYLNYNPAPNKIPWRDAIERAVQFFQGRVYTITRPRDLCTAWSDIMTSLQRNGPLSAAIR